MIDREYFEAIDLEQTVSILAEHPGARLVAGGTDLVVGARSGKTVLPDRLLAIHRVKELARIESTADGGLRIGALTTHAALEESAVIVESWTAISDASALVGSPATRHVGTIGGNICNASPAMELGSPLLVYDAEVELVSTHGRRHVLFGEFTVGPGRTVIRENEVMTAVFLPPLPAHARVGAAYLRLEYRQAMEIAIVGAAAVVFLDESDRCSDARVALTAVAPTCVRASGAEEILRGEKIDAGLLDRAAGTAAASARPIDDVRAGAAYRRAMVHVIAARAIATAHERAQHHTPL